ncbi:MAG: hypothetical protein EHM28_14895 [Spirochaetaceae bacterium]|nr:MAG: hypothetical protein EHM28_14895 [Spirochaetaceae bacterium]
MTINSKTLPVFLGLLLIGMILGGLAWEIVERIAAAAGTDFHLGMENPIGFDLHVVAVSILLNIGSLAGAILGILLFFRI